MPKHTKYKLKQYIKAVELFAQLKFGNYTYGPTTGSVYRFQLYEKKTDSEPCAIWVVHTEHDKNKSIWSKRDIEKASNNLCVSFDEFINAMKNF
jgi:hypothetical protein